MRFIPTGVGNSPPRRPRPARAPVHPHGRGELGLAGCGICRLVGSSPRAWGTRRCHRTTLGCRRFIPTGVGNSSGRIVSAVRPAGSSPRAWGTRSRVAQLRTRARFIPTGVGNSSGNSVSISITAVHPHGRGELPRSRDSVSKGRGSSPRAWGTRGVVGLDLHPRRFIPTGVGNSVRSMARASQGAVHPHGRGELSSTEGCKASACGSSPRAWGTR